LIRELPLHAMVGPDGLSIFRGISNTQPKLRAGSASVRGCWRFQIMPSKKRAFQRFLNSFWISLGIMAQKFSISLILKTSIVNLARTDASRIPIIRPAPIANMGDTFDRSALGATRSRNFDCDPLRSPCVLPQVPYRDMRRRQRRGMKLSGQCNLNRE
jgi:hypothetical protein